MSDRRYDVSSENVDAGVVALLVPIALVVLGIIVGTKLAFAYHSGAPTILVAVGFLTAFAYVFRPATLTLGDARVELAWGTKRRSFAFVDVEEVVVFDRTETWQRGTVRKVGISLCGSPGMDIYMRGGSDASRVLAERIAEEIRREAARAKGGGADGEHTRADAAGGT
jgi:hypothetical protein